jgi:hypothetical protein
VAVLEKKCLQPGCKSMTLHSPHKFYNQVHFTTLKQEKLSSESSLDSKICEMTVNS